MSFDDVVNAARAANAHAINAVNAVETVGYPSSDETYKKQLALAVATLATAVSGLAEEVKKR